MTQSFQHIGLIGKYSDDSVSETLSLLAQDLKRRGVAVTLDQETAKTVPDFGLEIVSRSEMGSNCDLVIVVGGDGTLLNAARSLAGQDVSVLGINLGRLGFMVDISPNEMVERLDEIFAGNYFREERSLLRTQIFREGVCISENVALNDVVVHKLDIARMVELEVSINGRLLDIMRADGLVVSTPTGSTAYALSGGGPILHPSMGAIALVPICPHTLSNRPIVVNEDSRIGIRLHNAGQDDAQVTHDGQEKANLPTSDEVQITTNGNKLCLLHPPGYDYFDILRAKLGWGGRR